ncbi:MAG: Fic family protein [Deltaproteobacteria bacterium]|nr:Fic family protein [Deltaproteobacteria bacterium]
MPKKRPHQLLAESLKEANFIAKDGILQSNEIERKHRERLMAAGCLMEVMRGWYLLTSPDNRGGSTVWFGGFWSFVRHYLSFRFGRGEFCLSAESSLNLHAGETTIPKQIVIHTKKASNSVLELPHNTSIVLVRDSNFPENLEEINEIGIMAIPLALCRIGPSYFRRAPRNIELVLKLSTSSVAEISRTLLRENSIASAERIVGAFKYLGEEQKSNQIKLDLVAAGYNIKDVNPYDAYKPQLKERIVSPYVGRLRLMWNAMREVVDEIMQKPPGIHGENANVIRVIQENYRKDAYHSLSIEGYQVTEDLISRIESGEWDPDNIEADRLQKDALAAKGYQNAFKSVIASISKVLNKVDSAKILEEDLQTWYRELFTPLLKANLFQVEKLAGYRDSPVYITGSRHVPPPYHAVPDCMETLFDLLKNESHAGIRAILGHFIFVYIHPYWDGNGRIGRFIMNFMLISGGYKWTVIRNERRDEYMSSLEKASTREDISDFAHFIKSEMKF